MKIKAKYQKNTLKKSIFVIIIFVLISISLININNIIGIYPSENYIKNCAIWSIQKSNNYTWQSYRGNEGSQYFSQKIKGELFGEAVDLEYVKEFKVVSEGYITKIIEINTKIPSVTFIAYRKIIDKDITKEFNTEFTYKFNFEGYHWLINEVSFRRI